MNIGLEEVEVAASLVQQAVHPDALTIFGATFDDSLDDWGRLELLLKNTEHVPDGERQAQFVCVITMVTPDGQTIQARGEIHGELTREARGENGFGYDPMFYSDDLGMTFAEADPEAKNGVSHRARAIRLLLEKLADLRDSGLSAQELYNWAEQHKEELRPDTKKDRGIATGLCPSR